MGTLDGIRCGFMCFSRADYILGPHIMIHLGLQQLDIFTTYM
eukprot:COSAG05_NODE_257_length_12748_cov_68.067120_3_plen_42_part_00